MERVKLTKAALNKFIVWSNSRYNDWSGYGTKGENVEKIYKALIDGKGRSNGYVDDARFEKSVFTIQCAGGVGETYNGKSFRYWKTKQSGGVYIVDCENMTIKEQYSGRGIAFLPLKTLSNDSNAVHTSDR